MTAPMRWNPFLLLLVWGSVTGSVAFAATTPNAEKCPHATASMDPLLARRVAVALGAFGDAPPVVHDEATKLGDETAQDLPAPVAAALAWEKQHGRLDFLLLPVPEGTSVKVPRLENNEQVRELYRRLQSPYSRLQLVSHFPGAFPGRDRHSSEHLQLNLARSILRNAGDVDSANDPLHTESVLAALATLHTRGTAEDQALLQSSEPWARRFRDTMDLVRGRAMKRTTGSTVATPEETRVFVEAIFRDVLRFRPELKIHIEHSNRVADLLVRLRNAQLEANGKPALAPAAESAIRVAAATHDLGKAFWPANLLAKTRRIDPADERAIRQNIATAAEQNSLGAEAAGDALALLSVLNRPIAPGVPLVEATEAHKTILDDLVKKNLVTDSQRKLLLSKFVDLSPAERAQVNEHPGAYRILALLDPNGLPAQLAQSHHEVLNGAGYPFAIDAKILSQPGPAPELIRLLTVADIFDAMTGPRPNSPVGMDPTKALEIMEGTKFAGQFDPQALKVLRKLVESGVLKPGRAIPDSFPRATAPTTAARSPLPLGAP